MKLSEVRTIKMGVHWEGMSRYYRQILAEAIYKSKILSKGTDINEWLDTVLDTIAYAKYIEAGHATCDCGCNDD